MRDYITPALAMVNLVLCAINAASYASNGDAFSLGVAVFCGGTFLFLLAADRHA